MVDATPALAGDAKTALVGSEAEASVAPRVVRAAGDPGNLLFPLDETYTLVDFFENGAPDQGNDDDSTAITLGFSFDLYGESYIDAFINNNGNVSFVTSYSAFTATGFPDSTYKMVAPFWADVDTRYGNGQVWHKLTSTTLVVTWDNVGYFSGHGDLRNTFQLAISDGTDPWMGIGNNVCFSYDEMEWTTGDASSGLGGFGGVPATAGANRGNGTDYFQIGRFDHEGTDYDGPGGNPDGVSYLDGSSFDGSGRTYCFNGFSETTNIAPIASGFPAGNQIDLDCSAGDVLDLDLSFLSPEGSQTTSVVIDDVHDAATAGLSTVNTPGNSATIALDWTPDCGNVGAYVLGFTATDSFVPPGETVTSLTINVNQPCGNGIVSGGEQCDDGNTQDGDCCSSTCQIESDTTVCRPAADTECDAPEYCDGSSPTCPANAASPLGTTCSADGNPCTDDVCDGEGICGVSNTVSCDDGLYCNGDDVCTDGACTHLDPPCGDAECSTCDEASDLCGTVAEGTACTGDNDQCTDDKCDGAGSCAHLPVDLAPACNWAIVGGSDTRASSIKTRASSRIRGSVCVDEADVGVSSSLLGPASWALMGDDGRVARVRSLASLENGRVATGGGCLSGYRDFPIFGTALHGEICCANGQVELPGGIAANVIDACGTSTLIEECADAKSQVPADVAMLDGLVSTQTLPSISVAAATTHTIAAGPGLNVIDIDRIKIGRAATLAIDALGNTDAVIVLRVARGLNAKKGVASKTGRTPTIDLRGGAQAGNVLFYAVSGSCSIGLNNTGAGTLLCPEGKVRMRVGSEWTGAVIGGGSVDIGIGVDLVHAPFLGFAQ